MKLIIQILSIVGSCVGSLDPLQVIGGITGNVASTIALIDPFKEASGLKSQFSTCMTTFNSTCTSEDCSNILTKYKPSILSNLVSYIIYILIIIIFK